MEAYLTRLPKGLAALSMRNPGRSDGVLAIDASGLPSVLSIPGLEVVGYLPESRNERYWFLLKPSSHSFGIMSDGSFSCLDKTIRPFVEEKKGAIISELEKAFGSFRLVLEPPR